VTGQWLSDRLRLPQKTTRARRPPVLLAYLQGLVTAGWTSRDPRPPAAQ
jgi:hypothetical protein